MHSQYRAPFVIHDDAVAADTDASDVGHPRPKRMGHQTMRLFEPWAGQAASLLLNRIFCINFTIPVSDVFYVIC